MIHVLRPTEREMIISRLTRVIGQTSGLLVGEASDELMEALQQEGFIVTDLGPTPLETQAGRGIELKARGGVGGSPAIVEPPTGLGYFVLALYGPLLPKWRDQLAAAGVELLEGLGNGEYVAQLDSQALGGIRLLEFVREVAPYVADRPDQEREAEREEGGRDEPPKPAGPSVRRDASPLAPPVRPQSPPGPQAVAYDVWLHRPADMPAVRQWLENQRISILGTAERKVRIAAPYLPTLERLRRVAGVAVIEPFVPPHLHNDHAAQLLGVNSLRARAASWQLTGRGQVVAVADTGLDADHPDLRDRLKAVFARGRSGDSSDPHGHGTHVAGSIVGTGHASGGTVCGIAPEAELVFQSVLDDRGQLGGLPIALSELFDEAYLVGARIHNNSWGSDTFSQYTMNSLEVDQYVHSHPDFLVIVSSGNSGTAAAPRHAKIGSVDWLSVCAPGTSKNAMVVGASRSDRACGGISGLTYNEVWPIEFPVPGIGAERVSGDPNALAAFSSRGPCTDRRVKPDVVAPGTDILSTRSSIGALENFWGLDVNQYYAFMGGTSMAAPLVAGTAALVRQYYEEQRGHIPSAALLKATLVNGTGWLTGMDARADSAEPPNMHQGFGRVSLERSLPSPGSVVQLAFVDTWTGVGASSLAETGGTAQWMVYHGGGEELRLCLAYSDLPGRALQNDLNLLVQPVAADGSPLSPPILGNAGRPFMLTAPDADNNVEIVRVQDAQAGWYLVHVIASNLLRGPQAFALVVLGAIQEDGLLAQP